jgi:P2 family phage contractile tail tube protein
MAVASDIRKNFNLFADGRGYAGQVDEVNAPKLTEKNEEFRAGGMNAPLKIRMGMEALDADFSLHKYDRDVLALFGIVAGQDTQFTLREALESYDDTVTPVAHYMRGRITEIDPGTSKAGEMAQLKCSLSLSYYKLEHGGRVIHEIDIPNMIHIVNGVDQMAKQRAALGM